MTNGVTFTDRQQANEYVSELQARGLRAMVLPDRGMKTFKVRIISEAREELPEAQLPQIN